MQLLLYIWVRSKTQELNVCWNMVFRRIFSYNKWESVRAVINGCGRLDVKHLILLRKVKFYRRIFLDNSYVLHKLFCALLSTGSLHDSCVISVFTVNAIEKIHVDFRSRMNWLPFLFVHFLSVCLFVCLSVFGVFTVFYLSDICTALYLHCVCYLRIKVLIKAVSVFYSFKTCQLGSHVTYSCCLSVIMKSGWQLAKLSL